MAGKKKEQCELSSEKQWGGRREKSGFPAKWSSKTKLVRIPERLESAIIEYAHRLDRGETEPTPDNSNDTVKNSTITEDYRQKEQTLAAIESILERWHTEATHHKQTSPRWVKVNELIRELFTELRSPWL
jgi:hypothetical protein